MFQLVLAFLVYKYRPLSVPIGPLTGLVVGLSTMRRTEMFHVYWNPTIAFVVRTVCLTGDMN
jgi:ABC-type thiamin/hydroxymethylpyrimidine transport system permease subunit